MHNEPMPKTAFVPRPPNLIQCPDCGKDVSKDARSCPNCGKPIKPLIPPIAMRPLEKFGAGVVVFLIFVGTLTSFPMLIGSLLIAVAFGVLLVADRSFFNRR